MERTNQQMILDQFKENDIMFRNTMERIFQKYSNLGDSGPDVCLKTMTLASGNGSVPLNSVGAEKELQGLRNQLQKRSLHALDSAQEERTLLDQDVTSSSCKMDASMADIDHSRQMVNSTSSLWCGSETSQLSLKSMSSSRSCLWGEPLQPEEEDQDLERTLNSNGRTLLDVYPSMLTQIGEVYRRQHITNLASSVLRRYRRRRWQSSQAQHHARASSNSYDHKLNRARESANTAPTPVQKNIVNHQKRHVMYHGSSPQKSMMDFSSLKRISNASTVSTACFYSPRSEDLEKSRGAETRTVSWTGEHSNSKSPHRPVRMLDLSTLFSSGSSSHHSPSPDLNQTYIIEPVPFQRSGKVTDTSVTGAAWSPLKMARMASLARERCNNVNVNSSPPRPYHHAGQRSSTTASPQKALAYLSQLRSPLKSKSIGNHQMPSSYPKQALPLIRPSGVCQSPHQGQRYPSNPQENPSNQLKCQQSVSSHYPSSCVSQMPRRQIDAEFMSLYHHFICHSTKPTSSCHLCKRRSGVQGPAVSSSSMSALSLTPVRSRVQKRHREPEVESIRIKRFRESRSAQRTSQLWPNQQQEAPNTSMNSAIVEDKYTRNRALFLQCPSPGFLGAIRRSESRSNRRRSGTKLDMQTQHSSPSWELLRCRCTSQGGNFEVLEGTRSPLRVSDQSGVSGAPRLSRRRLMTDF